MTRKPTIIPAILTDTPAELDQELSALAGWAPAVHFDVCDGQFVPSRSLTMDQYALAPTNLPRELHLMVAEPLPFLSEALRIGFGPILVHSEAIPDLERFLRQIRRDHLPVGVVVNPDTLLDHVLELAPDHLMVMGVQPGFQGAQFVPETVARIRAARAAMPQALLEVDGGVHEDTIRSLVEAGADRLVVGSDLWHHHKTPRAGYEAFQQLI